MDDVESDFSSIPGFEELDNELKCGICYERIITPMITSCSHTFCSLCIRKWLATKQVCPACSETVYESSLRRNPMVENIISALCNFMKKIDKRSTTQSATPDSSKIKKPSQSQFATPDSSKIKKPPQSQSATPDSSKIKKSPQSQLQSKSKPKTSNLSNDHNHDSDSDDDFLPKKTPPITPRMTANAKLSISSRASPSSNTPQRSVNEKISIQSLSSPPLKTPQRIMMKPSTSSPASSSSQALSSAAVNSPGPAVQKGPKVVACPVCSQLMPETTINTHLDKCLAGESTCGNQSGPNTPSLSSNHNGLSKKAVQSATPSTSQSVSKTVKKSNERIGQPLEPIKKMVYNLFKDAQLKKELKKYGLSVTGDRTVLLSRLNRYVAMHNAECDATNPRSLEELRKTFEKEDKSLIAPPSKSFSKLFNSKQPDPEEFDHHRKGYIKQNKSSFDTLVELARKTRQPKKESNSVPNGNVASTSRSISKVDFNHADSLSDSEEENLSESKEISKKLLDRELSSSDDDTNAPKSTKLELNKTENMTKKFIDPVVIDSSDSEIDYSPLGKDSPVKRHSDSDDSDNLSPEVCETPLNSQKRAKNVKRKVQCVESASDEEADKCGRPEKRASLEGRSPILARKTPVRRELRSRASQSKKVPIPSELPTRCRRSQRNAVKTSEDKPSSPDMFGTPPSSGSSDIPCGQAKTKQKDDAKDDDALSQLVSLIDDDGSTTDFED